MRRIAFVLAFSALLVPAAALAARDAAGDNALVVKNGEAPDGVPVVRLKITGSVIGQVTNGGKIIIDAGIKGATPEVTGAGSAHEVSSKDTAQWWSSNDSFKFRAVGGTFVILVYGSKVNLVAVGTGWVQLAGMPDTPSGDGWYSLNGNDRRSLPGTPTSKLVIGDAASG